MRRYDRARYHLADQWRFSLSNDLHPLVAEQVEAPPPARKAMGRSVLLHFEGGWSLKIYPRAAQRELVQRLLDMGFAVTVASGEDLGIACRKVRIGGVEHLKETLAAHAIFVGMDSFPTHYAVHVAKHPTLCLFASTQPQNSDAPPSAFYQALHRGLSCVPCSSATICPAFGGTECRNFTPPDEVARHVGELYTSSYLGAA
jgi:ADP-heptose:LPS heptosyltransferase